MTTSGISAMTPPFASTSAVVPTQMSSSSTHTQAPAGNQESSSWHALSVHSRTLIIGLIVAFCVINIFCLLVACLVYFRFRRRSAAKARRNSLDDDLCSGDGHKQRWENQSGGIVTARAMDSRDVATQSKRIIGSSSSLAHGPEVTFLLDRNQHRSSLSISRLETEQSQWNNGTDNPEDANHGYDPPSALE